MITPAAAGGSLTLALLDQLIDLVKGGKPDLLLMSKRTRRKLKALLTASAHYVESGRDDFGRQVMLYDGIPVLVVGLHRRHGGGRQRLGQHVLARSTRSTSTPADGLVGLTNGGIEAVDVGPLETKDASRVRIRWYVGHGGAARFGHRADERRGGELVGGRRRAVGRCEGRAKRTDLELPTAYRVLPTPTEGGHDACCGVRGIDVHEPVQVFGDGGPGEPYGGGQRGHGRDEHAGEGGDTVLAVPPSTLEAGIAVQGCHTVIDGAFKLRTTNASAGAVNPASASWTFVVLRH